jgi:hypothetical protein
LRCVLIASQVEAIVRMGKREACMGLFPNPINWTCLWQIHRELLTCMHGSDLRIEIQILQVLLQCSIINYLQSLLKLFTNLTIYNSYIITMSLPCQLQFHCPLCKRPDLIGGISHRSPW